MATLAQARGDFMLELGSPNFIDDPNFGAYEHLDALHDGYRRFCEILMESLLDPSLKESNDVSSQILGINQLFGMSVDGGKFAASRGFLRKVLQDGFSGLEDTMLSWCSRAKRQDPIANAIAALSLNKEGARDAIVGLLSGIMLDQGRFRSVANLKDPKEIAKQLDAALGALAPQHAKIIGEFVLEISTKLLQSQSEDDSREGRLYRKLKKVIKKYN